MMTNMDTVQIKLATYENIDVECPKCGRLCRYNRVTDLKTAAPISGMNIVCLHEDCAHPFRIVSDSVNARHEMLIYDCYPLIEEKRYAQCILNLCQAWECYFSLYFRVALCYSPFARDRLDISHVDDNLTSLYATIERWTYPSLRNAYAFIIAEHGKRVPAFAVDGVLSNLNKYKKVEINKSLKLTTDPQWKTHLLKLHAVDIDARRNRVVHKEAYRPSYNEVMASIEETRSTLFLLAQETGIMGEDPDWYLR